MLEQVVFERKQPFLAACVQFNPELYKLDENVDALLEVVTEAAMQGAKLIVTPEMATTGYDYRNRHEITPFVDTIPGHVTDRFYEVCKKYDTYIVLSMPEVDEDTELYYISAALIGPEGVIGKYRKIHLWEKEAHWAAPGNLGFPVFDTSIGKISINICMDSVYFESSRLAVLQGADILAFPTNSGGQTISFLQDRAEMNGLYVVSANRSNIENRFRMIGASAIWSPSGEKLAETRVILNPSNFLDIEKIVYATIDPMEYDNKAKERLKERRPELYKDLMLYIAPWDETLNTKPRDIGAAVIQFKPVIGEYTTNLQKLFILIHQTVAEAKQNKQKLDLIVLPELALSGPVDDLALEDIWKIAEEVDGEPIQEIQRLAMRYDINIVFGWVEKQNNFLYNSAMLINEAGIVEGKYQKTHLDESDKRWATPGDHIDTFFTERLGKVGMMIGYDAAFPEVSGVMTVQRADIVIIPSKWKGEFGRKMQLVKELSFLQFPETSMTRWNSIAVGSLAYTLVANYVGEDYLGASALYTLDPFHGLDQPESASSDKEEILIVHFSTLQTDWWFNQQKLIASRRTYHYQPMIHSKTKRFKRTVL